MFSCHHLVWNPKQIVDDKSEEGEDDIKASYLVSRAILAHEDLVY